MIEAHAAAYDEIHAVQPAARVGLSHNVRPLLPADPHDREDKRAVERADRAYNLATVEAVAKGRWLPPLGGGLAPRVRGRLDWIGLSYYGRDLIQFDGNRRSLLGRCMPGRGPEPLDGGMGEFYPQGLFEALQRLSRLRLPIYITENGIPDENDDLRPRYIIAHLHQVWRALQKSYPVVGYYHRTLVDSFEWSEGWTQRFGLHSFDPGSPNRMPRRSAKLMSEIVASGAITSELIDQYAPQLRNQLLPDPGPDA
jgi:beta-glucosidase/6-phospho-beta-glucosidase/beta-galactosidase